MKKAVAIVFLSIYLFNIGGPIILRHYAACLAERFYNKQISAGLYNKSDVTEIKLAVKMPGITDWADYESVCGQMRFNDVAYNYVAMKVTSTAIYLHCVPNYETTSLVNQNIIISKNGNQAPVSPKDHAPVTKMLLINQLPPTLNPFQFNTPVTNIMSRMVLPVQSIASTPPSIPEQPPKLVA